jgi:Glutaredoxin-like domain (DUF836)
VKNLILYSRAQCHLCEQLLEELASLLDQGERAAVRIVDIDEDPQLVRRYGLRIPVLTGDDGQELCSFPLDLARVKSYLGIA